MYCKKCNTEKQPYCFYKAQKSECKECTKIRVRKNYRANHDHYIKYERSRSHLPHRIIGRGVDLDGALMCHIPSKHPAHGERIPIRSNENKRNQNKSAREYVARYPERKKANTMVGNAIRDKKLTTQPCAWCGTENNVHGHHESYDKPLDVIWLCAKHHKAVHHGKIKVYG